MNLTKFSIARPFVLLAFVFVLFGWGLSTFLTMSRRENPQFEIRTAVVATQWTGANAEKVEQQITEPLESAIDELTEVEKVRSISRPGLSIIYVDVDERIADASAVWNKVRAKLDRERPTLPTGASEPILNDEFGDTSAMLLAVHVDETAATNYSPRELDVLSDRLKDELLLVPSVARVDRFGVRQEAIYLETTASRWASLELTTEQLQSAVERRNIVAPGGVITSDKQQMLVRTSGEFDAVEQIRNISFSPTGVQNSVNLEDLDITVSRPYQDPPQRLVRYSNSANQLGSEAIVLSVQMKPGFRIDHLGQDVQNSIEWARESILPPDVLVTVVANQPSIVEQSIDNFTSNLFQAVAIVFAVAALLLGLRMAFVMATAIPIVMLGSLALASLLGVELETFSIASLIIALGLLVDNAIEVADNIHRLMGEGKSRLEATFEGTRQIAFPVLIATLTTVAAFAPMTIALIGANREYVFSLPAVVSITLLLSYVVAMSFTALLAYWLLSPGHTSSPAQTIVKVLLGPFRRIRRKKSSPTAHHVLSFERLSHLALNARFLLVGLCFVLLVGAFAMVGTGLIQTQFFPASQRDHFIIEVTLPEGASIHATTEAVKQVEEIIHATALTDDSTSRLSNVVSFIGNGGPRFYASLDPQPPAANIALILVNATSIESVTDYVADVRREVQAKVSGARIAAHKLFFGPPLDAPISLRVVGDRFADLEILRHYSNKVQEIVRAAPGVWDVRNPSGHLGDQVDVVVNENRANLAGINSSDIARSLNAVFSGHFLTNYTEQDHNVPVFFRLKSEEPGSIATLDEAYVEGPSKKVPLNAIAEVNVIPRPLRIDRYELARVMRVDARVEPGLLANGVLLKDIWPQVEELSRELPPGYRIEIGGEQEETLLGQQQMGTSFLISFVLIVLLLVVQYNSFVKPLVILISIPLAIPGAFAGLYLLGQPLGFMAQVGLLSLSGIVVNAAIVLVEFIQAEINTRIANDDGVPPSGERSFSGLTLEAFRDSVVAATKLRITPIALTTLTTVGGLLPLALFGGPLFEPLASVVVFGLLFSTGLTLFVVPALVCIFVETFRVSFAEKGAQST